MIRSGRKKPRPGRLKGDALAELRRQCFLRDGYRCQHNLYPQSSQKLLCNAVVSWETGHMAHIKAKRMGGDSLDNVYCCCADHHRLYHAYGPTMQKPVPKKEGRS